MNIQVIQKSSCVLPPPAGELCIKRIKTNADHTNQHVKFLSTAVYTHLSSVAARMYFPLGENFTNDTGGLSSSNINRTIVST